MIMDDDVEKIPSKKGGGGGMFDDEDGHNIEAVTALGLDDGGTHLSFRAVAPVDVRVRDLAVHVDTTPPIWQTPPKDLWSRVRNTFRKPGDGDNVNSIKTVLNGVTASMPHGSLTAIIGGSGSGKTSLLNVMSGRMGDGSGRMRVSGTTTFNNSAHINDARSAYVMQQDVLIPTLTVRETLRYSADLRLPPPTTSEERHAAVEQVVLELGLKECADTRIGNNAHKGCSGGEKRRTSIGVQMLANPSVLFCDEPTTGMFRYRGYGKPEDLGLVNVFFFLTLLRSGCDECVSGHSHIEEPRSRWSNGSGVNPRPSI